MAQRKKVTRIAISCTVLLLVMSMVISVGIFRKADGETSHPFVELLGGNINSNKEQFYDNSVIYRLPDTVKDTDDISVIISTKSQTLLDAYDNSGAKLGFEDYVYSEMGEAVKAEINKENLEITDILNTTGVKYIMGASYDTLISGFEIVIKARDFEKVAKAVDGRAATIVGEVYENCETELVENNVDVYDTGIFDSSAFPYDGTGMVVAVLDTGLDYTHSAFSVNNFTADRSKLGLTKDRVDALVADTTASKLQAEKTQSTLTADDVYLNEKVPFAFDYADSDPDVYPIENDHGTHVAGIISGKDDVITGVAPNAQLVIMKTFSDIDAQARAPWILSALEDCVILGVDVINMSLGTSCGFSRETDKEAMSGVYDKIRERGISLIVAASNAFSSAYGSEKNGNLPLTSNPDSATVGSPGTYAGAMSVASINGAKTSYLLYNGNIVYFTESTDRVSEEKNFFDDIFYEGETELELEYVTIPGAGREADYSGIDVKGKIALVKRGSSTFEEKANVAEKMGARGVIIYNNVSGEIKMNVGDTKIAVCSIRQDAGEALAAQPNGIIKISRSQQSGPFMSDFSSWGPNPDLQIKPEITAHGGSILSSIPGQAYDRISGTSMATPNMAGVYALLRQYVIEKFPEIANDSVKINHTVNYLVMSSADIVLNTNGLPYSVRKQGAGLANLTNSALTPAYIMTYDRKSGELMDKTKIELGDDPAKTGVYELTFSVYNFGATALTYDVSAYVMTEGVSETKTNDGKTTVTEQGYLLDGAKIELVSVSNATENGSNITVGAKQTATVTVKITLGEEDKAYLNNSFENGMYVEGFVTLTAVEGTTVDLSVPYLAFYGDWSVAPIFDLDYFATNKDELDDSIDLLDKTLPDAYATRPIGQVQLDYVSYLGSFYFQQDPMAKKIAADRKYISLSNQDGTIHNLKYVWAGLLRNAATVEITITDDATGEVIFSKVERDIRKSYGDGGTPYPANIDIDFDTMEQNLKNNAKYTVTLKGYLDYENNGSETNKSNTFTFPLTVDFEAPALTDVEFYTEYDKTAKKTKLFAKVAIYDNHFAMAGSFGYITTVTDSATGQLAYDFNAFDKYVTPIYSNENSVTYVTYELTDHINELMNKAAKKNTFVIAMYDYALNEAMYEVELPDEFTDFYMEGFDYFNDDGIGVIEISPNEVYELNPKGYPESEWTALLEYISFNTDSVRIVNNKAVGVKGGTMSRIKIKNSQTGREIDFIIKVLAEGDEGYVKYDKPVAEEFTLTGYYIDKAYFILDTNERDLGEQPATPEERKENKFPHSDSFALSMFPSEAVTLVTRGSFYFPNDVEIVFESSNENIVKVDKNGKITAVAEGYASISVQVMMDGKSTYFAKSITITVKDPYITTGPSLTHYYGNGGTVSIPSTLAITEIGAYAFSNSNYIPKDENDEISDLEPELTKITYLGESDAETVIIPEGVKNIGQFAFAGLTKLKKVVLPSTIEKIDYGAFYNCISLEVVEGIENVKFINQSAFENCNLKGTIKLDSATAVANNAFAGNRNLKEVVLSEYTQSIAAYAFANCTSLGKVTINAEKVKLGQYAFAYCEALTAIDINASVIPAGTFNGCKALSDVTIGKDVNVIGEFAFSGSAVQSFKVEEGNAVFVARDNYLTNKEGNALLLVAPATKGAFELDSTITEVGAGAFSGNSNITSIKLPGVTKVGNYSFADCVTVTSIQLGKLDNIGKYTFYNTAISETPDLSGVKVIGDYAFMGSNIESLTIYDGTRIGQSAFRDAFHLESIVIGNNVIIGAEAFMLDFMEETYEVVPEEERDENGNLIYTVVLKSPLHSLTIGDNAVIGNSAFFAASELKTMTLGKGARIGDMAFYSCASLEEINGAGLAYATHIGASAFSGYVYNKWNDMNYTAGSEIIKDGEYVLSYHAAKIKNIELSALTYLGEDAFAYCQELETVSLGYRLKNIPARAFNLCVKLKNINLAGVETLGETAFGETALTKVDLSGATEIGKYAFVNCAELVDVTLNSNGAEILEGAFSYCEKLGNVNNLNKVTYVGDYAFAYTALTNADLSSAEYIGSFAFMKESMTDFKVTITEALKDIGDNPFVYCNIGMFSTIEKVEFNGKTYETPVFTYNINDNIAIIEGSLYRVVPTGYELIVYAGEGGCYEVAEGTTRVSAYAFAGSDIAIVKLPHSLKSIGHKAFYDCQELGLVAFASFKAPVLEEEYDINLVYSGDHIPAKGTYELYDTDGNVIEKDGLEIVPFYMWNASQSPTNVYYGANFVDYVGLVDRSIVMSRPVNGQYYDSMIYNLYFDTVVDGGAAMDEVTYAAKVAIESIPESIQLSDKAIIQAARAAYDKIATEAQKALISDLRIKLEQAEKRIADLEYLANNPEGGTSGDGNTENGGDTSTPPTEKKGCKGNIATTGVVIALVTVCGMAFVTVRRKKANEL